MKNDSEQSLIVVSFIFVHKSIEIVYRLGAVRENELHIIISFFGNRGKICLTYIYYTEKCKKI